MTVKVAINGFGRIGRCTFSHIATSGRNDIEVVAINATGPIEATAHLLRYDSVHGRFPGDIRIEGDSIDVGHGPIKVFSTYDPSELDWTDVDVVLECTGKFNSKDQARVHQQQGAKSVLISAPAKGVDRTVVFGVNHRDLLPSDTVISNGSCTTNCLAPMAKILNDAIGIEAGIMTTVHSYTGDQPTLDRRHSDLYRARAAALSLIPTSTGAAKAIGEVLPELKGKLDGSAIRVPTPNVSAVDLTFRPGKLVHAEDINAIMAEAAANGMRGIVSYETEPKVSIDYNHETHSCNFASDQTKVIGGRLVRVLAWYDNEWGFSCRMADNAAHLGRIMA
ncbi:Glyceraldehyde-3-phosphate dehydrogenase [Thalassovita gelatinovora]|uniref:Glyceraldehyde-3-phosphate dehydrogenase n=1 Tax=Thalassovita gelatinovora TaxID=53501 RepID=A0A0P1F8U0_THAGE|nr:type I glyceraldehyde-3-phosphate dehydrogenase [Thalassovita gelatinovora]QIZ80394.1 type I glyceraldehyde-3-phosphate dehydrogenase [Thalassovita gelatinovora]CUH64372.1 Glyceraldehyde-3-phosphate dehydrogenase [Thalassovita gelatinovora]SEQ92596.1 glyceraldehyde-3-phosphate dehydrogenase (NAD+) [Thalassovita gelatinovora]